MSTLNDLQVIALKAVQEIVGEANAAKGFHDEGERLRTFATQPETGNDALHQADIAALRNYWTARLSLITTEVAEAIEEIRHGRAVDETYYSGGLLVHSDTGYTEDAPVDGYGKPRKPEGVPSKLADIVIRAFDFAHEAGINLAEMIDEKLTYNATRAHKHGKEF